MIFYDLLFTTSRTLTDNTLRHKINELLDKECADRNFTAQVYEVKNNLLAIKNMSTGEQVSLSYEDALKILKNK